MKNKEVELHMIDLDSLRKPTYKCEDSGQVYISIQAILSVRNIDLNIRTMQNRIKNNLADFGELVYVRNISGTRPRPYIMIDKVDEFISILEEVKCVIK